MSYLTRKAIAVAIAGTAVSVCAVSAQATSTTYYNTYGAGSALGSNVDGWTHTNGSGNSGALQAWYGPTGTDPRPFDYAGTEALKNYKGAAALNWAVHLDTAADSAEISVADASARYGSQAGFIAPDLDTAQGSWVDSQPNPGGWGMYSDYGLILSDVTRTIRLTPYTENSALPSNFGISVYSGKNNQLSGAWNHHGAWNTGYIKGDNSAANLAKVNGNNPLGITGLNFVGFVDGSGLGPNGGSYLEFQAQAGQVYSVILGGAAGTQWKDLGGNPIAAYKLQVAAVPVPGAVWLFSSAMAGLGVLRKRKAKAGI
ncbi:MAG: hypothetical protein ABL925_20195 [Methylococcales bacterium]